MKFFIFPFILILSVSCTRTVQQSKKETISFHPARAETSLHSLNIIDRNGISEVISSKERLKNFEKVDFLSSQPYQKVLRVYTKDKAGITRSFITTYHPNGELKQYLEIVNGRASGYYCEWHPNGKLKLSGKVIAGAADIDGKSQVSWSFDGIARAFREDGSLQASIPYEKGQLHGDSITYYSNGVVETITPYCKNEIHGVKKSFSEQRQLIEFATFDHGIQDGDASGFFQEGNICWKETYAQGKLQTGTYFDRNGKEIASIDNGSGHRVLYENGCAKEYQEYKNGLQEGEVSIFHKEHLICRYSVKNGEKHGEEIRYYPFSNSCPKLSISWYEGKIHGPVCTWYENGAQESKKEMCQNAKHGLFSAWYRDGTLMLIEEYEKDRLLRGSYLKRGESTPVSTVENGSGKATLFDGEGNLLHKVLYRDGKPVDD